MSLEATRWAWTKTGLRPIHKLILLSISDRANADDKVLVPFDQIVEDTGADRKTIMNGLRVLQALGLISPSGEVIGKDKIWKLHFCDCKDASI